MSSVQIAAVKIEWAKNGPNLFACLYVYIHTYKTRANLKVDFSVLSSNCAFTVRLEQGDQMS
jgi:hypothetical protein